MYYCNISYGIDCFVLYFRLLVVERVNIIIAILSFCYMTNEYYIIYAGRFVAWLIQ